MAVLLPNLVPMLCLKLLRVFNLFTLMLLLLVRMVVVMPVGMRLALRQLAVFKYMDLGAADAAAVYGFDLQTCADIERGRSLLQHIGGHAGIQQRAKEHIAGNSGKAVKIGDSHRWLSGRKT